MEHYRIDSIRPYLLGSIAEAINEARRSGRDVIDLSQANPDLMPPTIGVDKLVESVLRPQNHRYSSSQGINKLRESIAKRYFSKYQINLDPGTEVTATLGTKEGLAHLLLAISNPGDHALIPSPTYPVHSASLAIAGINQICVEIPRDDQSFIDAKTFIKGLEHSYSSSWPQPRILILSFPHNPTTKIVTIEFWQEIIKFAKEKQLIVINDFAYADICFEDYHAPSILAVEGAKEVAVEFYSLSKAYGIAGWRIGFCVGNKDLVQALKKIKSYIDFGNFQPIQIAAIKVIEEADSIISENVAVYQARRDILVSGLNDYGWKINSPKATVFVWARIPEKFAGLGSIEFCQLMLKEADVAACPGEGFDAEADNYVRFALVGTEARIRRAVLNIGKMLK